MRKTLMGFAALLACAGPWTASSAAQDIRTIEGSAWFVQEWRAQVAPTDAIHLEDLGGDMDIGPSTDGAFHLELQIPVSSRSRADALAWGREFAPGLDSSRDGLIVDGKGVPRGARYRVRVPRASALSVETDGGSLFIHDVSTPLRIDHAGGPVRIASVPARISLESAGGDIELNQIGGNVEIQSDGGDVAVDTVTGDLLIVTGGGKVEVAGIRGSASITTAGGNIEVSGVTRDLKAVTSAGRIEADEVGGSADLNTGGGDIEVSSVSGSLTASSAGGDIEADAIKGRIRVEALAGDVELAGVVAPVRVIGQVGDVEIEVVDPAFLRSGLLEVDLGHGDISLVLPRRTHALLQANIQEEGTIDIARDGWKVEVLRTRGGAARQAEVRIGEGGGTIRITLRSGEISVDHS